MHTYTDMLIFYQTKPTLMKKLYFFLSLLFLIYFSQNSWGQVKLGNNPSNIDPTALLELESSTQALLLPRLTSAQRDALPMDTSPIGLLIFNTDLNQIQYLYEATVTTVKGEKRQELRWESATDNAIPFARPTNPILGQLFYDNDAEQLSIWNGNAWVIVGANLANTGGATSTISYQNLTLVGSQLSISNGNTVDLSSLVGATGPAGPQGPTGPQGSPATDDQTLTASALSMNNTLTIAISGGNTEVIDLSNLNQDITGLSFDSKTNSLTVGITNGASETVDLSNLNQDIAELAFDSTTNSLTVGITDGASQTIELTALAPTGLVSVTEGGNAGHRLATSNVANHGDIGAGAIDLSTQTASSTSTGARGDYSLAAGQNTIASGNYSVALGENTNATGNSATTWGLFTEATGTAASAWGLSTEATDAYATAWGRDTQATGNSATTWGLFTEATVTAATAWGRDTQATGEFATAWGRSSTASASYSTAFGLGTTAETYGQTTIGTYNTTQTGNATNFIAGDRLLVVGNGTSSGARSDALVILKDGTTTLNGALTINTTSTTASYTLPVGGGTNGQVLSMLDANSGTTTWTTVAGGASTGLASVTEGGFSGHRLATEDAANHGDIGRGAVDLSIQTTTSSVRGATGEFSFALGSRTTASGDYSTAFGRATIASETYSTAFGFESEASGEYSTAFGNGTTASGNYSTAFGNNTQASGNHATAWGVATNAIGQFGATAWGQNTTASASYSTAFGLGAGAESYGQTSIGTYNTTQTGNATSFVPTDRLFVIGNGANIVNRSDALVILKNGNTTLNGALTIDPTGTSSYTLPTARGTAGQVLSIDNATTGTTTWTTLIGSGVPQFLSASALSDTNTLTIDISGGNQVSLDLSALAPTGLASVTEGGNTGHRLVTESAANHGDIGNESVDLSIQDVASGSRGATGDFSFALGRRTTASGNHSTAFGTENSATADYSTAFGNGTTASGNYSTAFGNNTQASGNYATAWGVDTNALGVNATVWGSSGIASGTLSTAFGGGTTAESYGQTTLGFYNTAHPGTPNTTANVGSDRLLVVGNGTGSTVRSDALVILKNGNTTLNGALTLDPTGTSSYTLPTTRGTAGQVLTMLDATTGTTHWTTPATGGGGFVGSFKNLEVKGKALFTNGIELEGTFTQKTAGTLHADYVFESYFDGISDYNPSYSLPSLAEVEQFVKTNKHLPGVQSRAAIQAEGKWDVTENVRTNLEKVEELYLHTIEQQKQLGAQQEQLEAQQKEIETLKAMIKDLMEKK